MFTNKDRLKNKPLHILLADDDEGDRLLFKEALEELKIKTVVQTVNNGVELINYLQKAQGNLPQLVFIDLNMPRKNGLQCLKEIRADRQFNEISIAIYSTSTSESDINETFIHGANVYIKKPNDFETLKKLLDKALSAVNQYQEPPFNIANFLMRL